MVGVTFEPRPCRLINKIIGNCLEWTNHFKRHSKSQKRCGTYTQLIPFNVQVLSVRKTSVNVYNSEKWGLTKGKHMVCRLLDVSLVKLDNLPYKSDNLYSMSNGEYEVCQDICKCRIAENRVIMNWIGLNYLRP